MRKRKVEIRSCDGTPEWRREYQAASRRTPDGRRTQMATSLKQMHGLSLEQYAGLWDRQRGLCAICRKPLIRSYDPDSLVDRKGPRADQAHIDHDHGCCPGRKSCGSCVRGLLCPSCNTGLACFRDKSQLLLAAATYVARSDLLVR